jgi:uncharacterized protein YidB (DUF937 family)
MSISFNNALTSAVPGGNLAVPIAAAAGVLLVGRALANDPSTPPVTNAPAAPAHRSGGLLSGLHELIEKFRNGGEAETVDSWIGHGPNASVPPGQLRSVLGHETISDLMRHSGLSEQELLTQLAKVLPNLVDNLTPEGRLPTPGEVVE